MTLGCLYDMMLIHTKETKEKVTLTCAFGRSPICGMQDAHSWDVGAV